MRQTASNTQRATRTCNATCNGQRAACNRQQTTWKRQPTACTGQQATRQQAADNKATCGMRQTERKRWQPPGNACSRQRATDSRRHARGREHMRDATGHTRHCRISCATSSGQRTTCSMREALHSTTSAQHGTDVHRRHTQDATYGRCRSMQQTHTEATTRSRQSNARDERGDKWKPDARAPRGCVGLAAPAMVEWRLDYRSSRLPLPCLLLPAVPECVPRELRASHDSTAMSLPSTPSSSASEASRNASNRAAPSVSSSGFFGIRGRMVWRRTRCRLLPYGR